MDVWLMTIAPPSVNHAWSLHEYLCWNPAVKTGNKGSHPNLVGNSNFVRSVNYDTRL